MRSTFVRMFQRRFAALVQDGWKRQTIRPIPKRMPQPGDYIDCREWVGIPYRSKQRRLRRAVITTVRKIHITPSSIRLDGKLLSVADTVSLAKADGFISMGDFFGWFYSNHSLPFAGILITW